MLPNLNHYIQWDSVTPIRESARFMCKYDGVLTKADVAEIFHQTRHVATVVIENDDKYVFLQSDRGGQLKNAIDLAEQKYTKMPYFS